MTAPPSGCLAELDAALSRAPEARAVIVDMANVEFFDSSAIHVVWRAGNRLTDAVGAMVLANVPPFTRRVLELVGLLDAFPVKAGVAPKSLVARRYCAA